MNDEEIRINLTLDDKGFRITALNAGNVVRDLERRFDQTAASVHRLDRRFNGIMGTFKSAIITLGAFKFALMDIESIFLTLPRAIVETNAQFEKMTVLMRGLSTASTEAARALEAQAGVDAIINLAQRAPYEMKALQDAFVKLKAGGLDPLEGGLQALVDSVARFGGSNEHLHRAAVAIQQMGGKGVISMEELRQQLGEAVPNALEMMARGMNMTMGELVKEISNGTVESSDALRRMFTMMRLMNGGAAEDLMETWDGLMSRMKTQWQLLQKQIGDASFMDALKEAANELLELMQTPEAQQFAVAFGETLAEAVRMIRDLSVAIGENIELIKYAGQALIAAYVGSKVISGIKALNSEIDKMYGGKIAKIRAESIERSQAVAKELAQESARLKQKIAADQAELDSHTRKLNLMVLAEERAQQKIAALRTAGAARLGAMSNSTARVLQPMGTAAENAAVQARIAALNKHSAAVRRDIEIQRRHNDELRRKLSILQQNAAGLDALAASASKATISVSALQRASAMGSVVLGALGGPIGLVTTALALFIPVIINWSNRFTKAWEDVASAYENGIARMAHAEQAAKNVAQQRNIVKALELELQQARDIAKLTNLGGLGGSNQRAVAALEARLAKEYQKLEQMEKDLIGIRQQAAENTGRDIAAREQREFERQRSVRERHLQAEIAQINERHSKILGALDANSAEYIKALNARETEIREASRRFYEAELQIAYQAMQDAEQAVLNITGDSKDLKGGNPAVEAALAWRDQTRRYFNETSEMLRNIERLGDPIRLLNKKNKDAEKTEKSISDRIADKVDELQSIRSQIEALGDGLISLDEMGVKAENSVRQLMRSNKLRDDDGNVIADMADKRVQQYINILKRVEQAKVGLKGAQRMFDESVKLSEDVENARDAMNDPFMLRMDTRIRGIERLEAQLRKNAPAIDKELENIGMSFESFMNKMKADAAFVDMEAFLRPLVEETREINTQLAKTERERIRLSQQAEREYYEARFKMLRDYMVEHGRANEELLSAQDRFNEFMRAKSEQWARESRTPMQALGEEWQDITAQMEQATTRWADSAIDAIMEFVRTGKMEWGKFVEQIIYDLIRIQMQRYLAGALSYALDGIVGVVGNLFSGGAGAGSSVDMGLGSGLSTSSGSGLGLKVRPFADGGIMTEFGEVPLRKYARGGIANSPQLALFGEGSMPEAYVPLPDGRRIPVNLQGGGGTVVNVNVIEAPGTRASVNQSQDEQGNVTIDVMIEQIEGKLASNIARGRSAVGQTLENTYGLTRSAGALR